LTLIRERGEAAGGLIGDTIELGKALQIILNWYVNA
jgi:hypothetical protein